MVRAKFKVENVLEEGGEGARTVVLRPVYGDGKTENAQYWRYTPSGEIRLGTVNEAAWSQFKTGQEFYVDFTPARTAETDETPDGSE